MKCMGDFLNCLLFMTAGKIHVLNILFTLGKQSQPVNWNITQMVYLSPISPKDLKIT